MFNSSSFARGNNIISGSNQGQKTGSLLRETMQMSVPPKQTPKKAKKRNLPGNPACDPDPDVEVVALSPASLEAEYGFFCEICHQGFKRDQNLQLHKRTHNLSVKIKQKTYGNERKRVYICPESTCIYHHPSKALGDITGIKRHHSRKHYCGEKKWECEKCSKRYAVECDWKAHTKKCGKKKIANRDPISYRKKPLAMFKVAAKNAKLSTLTTPYDNNMPSNFNFYPTTPPSFYPCNSQFPTWEMPIQNPNLEYNVPHTSTPIMDSPVGNWQNAPTTTLPLSSTNTLFQKAVSVGTIGESSSNVPNFNMHDTSTWQISPDLHTHDFLGLAGRCTTGNVDHGEGKGKARVSYSGQVDYQPCDHDHTYFNHQKYVDQNSPTTWGNFWC